MLPIFDIVKRFIPPHIRIRMQNWIVDTLAEATSDEHLRNIIRAYRTDAEFQASLTDALERAVQRFITEYDDVELIEAITQDARFWDIPRIQNALKEIVTRPSSYLKPERALLKHSFSEVVPTLEPERVERAVQYFLHGLTEEVVVIPQLAHIYQAQFQWAALQLQNEQNQLLANLVEITANNQRPYMLEAERSEALLPLINHNLPPQYGDFLGRKNDVARVQEGLDSRWPLVSIEGMGGIGKTTLAIQTAHLYLSGPEAALDSSFKYVVWVSAKDAPERKYWLNEVLDAVARVLGYPAITKMLQTQKQYEIDRLLRNYRTLIIIDDFHTMRAQDSELVDWIYRIPEPSKILLTSRQGQLSRSFPITLKGLEDSTALELIRNQAQRLELSSIKTVDDSMLMPLVKVTGGNPLAIELALGYVKRGSMKLREVVELLYDASQKFDNIFDHLFGQAWETMTEDAQKILLVTPFFEDYATKKLLGIASELAGYSLDNALEELVTLMLLESNEDLMTSDYRYSVHPLTRAFALARLREKREFEEQARARWYKYYMDFAINALVKGKNREIYWNSLVSLSSDMAHLDQEWPNLRKVLAWADQTGQDHILVDLMLILAHYMDIRFLYPVRFYYARRAATAAKRLNREKDEALLRIDSLGWTLMEVGHFQTAVRQIKRGLRIANDLNNMDLLALANAYLARVFLEREDLVKASEFIHRAMPLDCQPVIRCRVDMIAGDIASKKNDNVEALKFYENALHSSLRYRDEGESTELFYRLGLAYLANGDLVRAETHFKKVLDVNSLGVTVEVIHAKYGSARVAKVKGEIEKALHLAGEALNDLSKLVPSHMLIKEIQNFLDSLRAD